MYRHDDFRYFLSSSRDYVQCLDGVWMSNVTCERVSCGTPLLPHARLDCPNGLLYESVCKFNCRTPAIMRGSAAETHVAYVAFRAMNII